MIPSKEAIFLKNVCTNLDPIQTLNLTYVSVVTTTFILGPNDISTFCVVMLILYNKKHEQKKRTTKKGFSDDDEQFFVI